MYKCENCGKDAKYYRKIDSNPRPLCRDCYNKVGRDPFSRMMIQRHYFKVE